MIYHFKGCELENSKKKNNLFCEIFGFHNSKEDVNFAKYIVADILAKFKYFEKKIIFWNSLAHSFKMISHLSALYEPCSHQNFQKWA